VRLVAGHGIQIGNGSEEEQDMVVGGAYKQQQNGRAGKHQGFNGEEEQERVL
jgi:hypothetical protein